MNNDLRTRTEFNLVFTRTFTEDLTPPIVKEEPEVKDDLQKNLLEVIMNSVVRLEVAMNTLYQKMNDIEARCTLLEKMSNHAGEEARLQRVCQVIFEGMQIPPRLEVKLVTDPKDFAWRVEKEFSRIRRQSDNDDSNKVESSCTAVEHAIAESEICKPHEQRVGYATEIGIRHKKNEDRFCCFQLPIKKNSSDMAMANCFALFDGHGGDEASEFCYRQFEGALLLSLQHLNKTGADYEIGNALKMTFVWLDTAFRKEVELKKVPSNKPGCTACVVLFTEDGRLFTANAGDSRALFHMPESCNTIRLSFDFKASDQVASKSVIKRGGVVVVNDRLGDDLPRVEGSLAITRAIGDEYLRKRSGVKVTTPRPKVTVLNLRNLKDKIGYLLLCSDGLTDVINTPSIAYVLTVLHQKWGDSNPSGMAHCLVKGAKKAGTHDDTTVGVIPLSLHHSQSV